MALLNSFKQSVLDLGRGEAKAKAKPLTIRDEALDRSASGLDRRTSERAVMFLLLSDRALFLVVGFEDARIELYYLTSHAHVDYPSIERVIYSILLCHLFDSEGENLIN